MFTSRHDERLWIPHITGIFPNVPSQQSPGRVRGRVYNDLEAVRQLRNRIAHHEPIFTRALADDLTRMFDLVQLRCSDTAAWVRALEDATAVLEQRPVELA